MWRILLVCTSGISTTLLVNKMKEAIDQQNLDVQICAIGESAIEKQVKNTDIILLGPQSRHLQSVLEQNATCPIMKIDVMAYSKMDGEAVLKNAMKILHQKE